MHIKTKFKDSDPSNYANYACLYVWMRYTLPSHPFLAVK